MLGLLVPWRLALFAPAAPAAAPAMAGSPEDREREKESPTGLSPLTPRLRSAALCPRNLRWMAPPGLAVCLCLRLPQAAVQASAQCTWGLERSGSTVKSELTPAQQVVLGTLEFFWGLAAPLRFQRAHAFHADGITASLGKPGRNRAQVTSTRPCGVALHTPLGFRK